jgi:electron transport complex protein RnfC
MGLAINNVKTFPMGGVHPAENKFTADKPVEKMEVPKQVSIPISQHIGAPAKPVVEQREKVKVGQVIATSAGFVSANIHATIAGTVAKIDKVMDSTGYKRDAIIIKAGKEEQEWADGIDLNEDLVKDFALQKDEIIKKVAKAGIVGLGGATFPSHVKAFYSKRQKSRIPHFKRRRMRTIPDSRP